MARLGLDGRLRHVPVAELSAGQRRRASVAALVARRPELWLLDEPHAGLDADGRDLLDALVREAVGRLAPPCCSPPTSSTGPAPSPIGPSSWPAARCTCSRRPSRVGSRSVLRDAALVAGKDLRIEARVARRDQPGRPVRRARAVLFAFALDPDRGVLAAAAPGLFWVAVLFSALLAIQRSFAIESADGGRDGLRLSGLDPAGIFLGKAAAVAAPAARCSRSSSASASSSSTTRRCTAPSCSLVTCVAAPPPAWPPRARSTACSRPGCGCARRCCPCCCSRWSRRVLLAATRACEAALAGAPADGWPWVQLLGVFAVVYIAFGVLAFGPLLEEA